MKKRILAFTLCLVVAFMFGACGKTETDSSAVAVTVNGEEISMDELRYFVIQSAAQLSNEHADPETGEVPEDFWKTELEDGKTAAETALERALEGAVEFRIYKIEAKKLGLTLTEEDKEQIQSQKKTMLDSYGEVMYEAQLKAAGFTDSAFLDLMELSTYSQKLFQHFIDGLDAEKITAEAKEYFKENYLKAKHILISTQDMATGTALEGEALEAKEALVKEVQDKLASGANFDDLVKEYGEDPGMETNAEGYVFTEGDMVPEFYEGAKALKVGEVSEPITTSYGIHIIKREELLDSDYDSYADTVKNTLHNEKFVEKLEEYKEAADVKKTSVYKKIDVEKVYEQYQKEYEEASVIIEQEYAKMQEKQEAESETPETEGETAQPEEEGTVPEEQEATE